MRQFPPSTPGARSTRAARLTQAALALLLAACGGGAAEGVGPLGQPGSELPRPGGGTFFLDDHRGGTRARLRLVEVLWGRLVDVHDVDEHGRVRPEPVFRDLVVREDVLSDGIDYRLETNPVTFRARLVVLRTKGAPGAEDGFEALLARATGPLSPVVPKGAAVVTPGPFSLVPRDATLVLRFDDLLDDSAERARDLPELVRLVTGYPAARPFPARAFFDPNHGGVSGGAFHSTRVLLDATVSEAEALDAPEPLAVNVVGLPASRLADGAANCLLRLPTRVDFATGQFDVLRSLGGAPLADEDHGPLDTGAPTVDVVRAFRSGNEGDLNQGYLFDFAPPRLVGGWRIEVLTARAGGPGRWVVALEFANQCRSAPRVGHILELGGRFLEVVTEGFLDGQVYRELELLPIAGPAPDAASTLLGAGFLQLSYDPSLGVPAPCWLTVVPDTAQPGVDLSSFASVRARFSEPLFPASVRGLDTFRMIRGRSGTQASARTLVVGSVGRSDDFREFSFTPALPLDNVSGTESYSFEIEVSLDGLRDLAGNTLPEPLPAFEWSMDPREPPQSNGGIALRFASLDEVAPPGRDDFRGQMVWDEVREVVTGRPVEFASAPVDEFTGTLTIMAPFVPGVQTPLSPFGSKLQAVWRYADLGWAVRDESKYDLDVTGLSWSPRGGRVVSDFYPRFEMRLSHSRKLPDEQCTAVRGPAFWDSGLGEGSAPFTDNLLTDSNAPQVVVHPDFLGYRVEQGDLFVNGNGVPMLPFPLNRGGGQLVTYTWRDTSIQAVGAPGGTGVPMGIEVGAPLFLETDAGSLAGPSMVPSIGLPLLWEIRCFPTSGGIGVNPFRIRIACPLWPTPNFRAFSTGGINATGNSVTVDPALEEFPRGGYNPSSKPPGKPTTRVADNSVYIGQLDYVVRVTRMHTAWMDTALAEPVYATPVVEPAARDRPLGTDVVLDFRGAHEFTDAGLRPFDAQKLNTYGDFLGGTVSFHDDDPSWRGAISEVDGARFLQVRISFVADVEAGDVPEVDSLGIAFRAR